MATATLTWSLPHGDSNLQSTFGTTNQGAIQLLNEYFTALAAFSDFPWTVCSFEGTTAPWVVTLKRKNGSPGRIIFVGFTTAPGLTYNPQLGSINWNATGVRAGFFPLATSDTPQNIVSTSGDVFTNPGGSSGLGPCVTLVNGSNSFNCFACEDGIVLKYGLSTSIISLFIVGDFLEDAAGNQAPVSGVWNNGNLDGVSPQSSPLVSSYGALTLLAGESIHFGTGWQAPAGLSTYQRDNSLKRSWFYPRSLCSFTLPQGEAIKYKLRQITYGPTPLAAYEQLTDVGSVVKAISISPSTISGFPWLTNFKV